MYVAKFSPIDKLQRSAYKPSATHNFSIRSDEGLTLKTSVFNFPTFPNTDAAPDHSFFWNEPPYLFVDKAR